VPQNSFDLNNILEGFIYKDACRNRIFSFSHGGKGLVVWKGYAPRLVIRDRYYINNLCTEESFFATYGSQNEGRGGSRREMKK
jgi:hypothetical protein